MMKLNNFLSERLQNKNRSQNHLNLFKKKTQNKNFISMGSEFKEFLNINIKKKVIIFDLS